ncbi:hypothetical protein WJX77_004954 [Trebouxia sp. C0004]
MGSCASCCGGKQSNYDEMDSNQPSAAPVSDPEARARAAAAAEQRQQKFDQSAGGRAARKAVADVAKERQAGHEGTVNDASDSMHAYRQRSILFGLITK